MKRNNMKSKLFESLLGAASIVILATSESQAKQVDINNTEQQEAKSDCVIVAKTDCHIPWNSGCANGFCR